MLSVTLLALDASTTAVGWAIFEDGDYRESGVYVPPKELEWWHRISYIGNWLGNKLAYDKPTVTAYEIATGNRGNMHTNRLLGAVEYEVRLVVGRAYRPTCDFLTVTASQVRATECHKEALDNAVGVKGGVPLDKKHPGDEADAIGVGLAALKVMKEKAWASEAS